MPILHPGTRVSNLVADNAGRFEGSQIQVSASDTGVYEVQTVTVPATASAAQGDYVIVLNAAGDSVAIWLDIDANGTEPAGALYLATDAQVEVDIVTGGTAAQNAALLVTALGSTLADATIVDSGLGVVTITQDLLGNVTAPARHNAAEDGNGSFVVATSTGGAASTNQSTYLTFRDNANAAHYAWMNVGGEGVDPAPGGTGHEVTFAASASASTQAAAIASAINAVSGVNARDEGGGRVVVTSEGSSNVTDIGAGDSLMTVSVLQQGVSAILTSSTSTSSLSNNPSLV